MKTVPLSEARGYIEQQNVGASEEAKLIAEISERMLELIDATSQAFLVRWLNGLKCFEVRDPVAQLWYLRIQTGDISWHTRPYSSIGNKDGTSKQAVEQSFERALKQVEMVRPSIAKAIRQYRQLKARTDTEESEGTTA